MLSRNREYQILVENKLVKCFNIEKKNASWRKNARRLLCAKKIKVAIEQNSYNSKKFIKREVTKRLETALSKGIRIYIDCSYEPLMSPKECNKFAQQLCRLYGANKKATSPFSLNLVSFSQCGPLFQACQSKCDGFLNYKIGLYSAPASSITPENIEIVYLSPDAKEPLLSISENCAYVIGCLVDEHILKGQSQQEAKTKGCRAFRLPIQEFCYQCTTGRKSSPVLAINHVIDILLAYKKNGGDWKAALEFGLPRRFLK
uniref:SJCHGC04264 protein n=1 Tax=Schistosoma japonicum TaxID=6182 RepID=Q5DG75_SCHJA|nr:SJCHGC04264 protein [Schistosoma japonicum]